MLNINSSGKFKKDLRICVKCGYNIQLLHDIIEIG